MAATVGRTYQWADGSAYVSHVELVRKARNVDMPASFWEDPLMYQGGSDDFIGPMEDIVVAHEAWGIDFEVEVAVITDDVPMGSTPDEAYLHIKLLMLVNDVSLRNLIPPELAKGFGFLQSKPGDEFFTGRRDRTNWAMHGRTARCTCRCARRGTAGWSGSRTRA